MVLFSISGCYAVDHYTRERRALPHQQRLPSDWLDSLIHQRPHLNKLKGGVWEVQSVTYAIFTGLVVYTLVGENGKEREEPNQARKSTVRYKLLPFQVCLCPERNTFIQQRSDSQLRAGGRARLRCT